VTLDLTPYRQAVEQEMRDILSSPEPAVAGMYRMMQYHMGWLDRDFQAVDAPTGKRLRPVMCLLACTAVGGDWRAALPAAASVELVHNFSLIHDDIEDNSFQRRHRDAVWHIWGIAQGINTGDAMWALSRLALHRLAARGHDAETILRVSRRIDETCLALCTGQYLDISFEGIESVTLSEYERMVAGKTAALLSGSLAMGAILGGADDKTVSAFGSFGHEFGLSFQIIDDILGIWGDPEVTGKSAASDILERKKTLPVLYAIDWEQQQGYNDLAQIYAAPRLSPDMIPTVLERLERADALGFSRQQARNHHHLALEHLQQTETTGPAYETLKALALSLIDRSS
jgi:geranylgeranyl diphosphate synthase type I